MTLFKLFMITVIFGWLVDIIDKILKRFEIDDSHTPSLKKMVGRFTK